MWGHPLKGTCQEKKLLCKQEIAFSWEYDAAARMGRQLARRSSRHLIDSFDSPLELLPTLYGRLRFFLTKDNLYRAINFFPYAVVSFRFTVSVSERVVPT
jgi:hypothetical protein